MRKYKTSPMVPLLIAVFVTIAGCASSANETKTATAENAVRVDQKQQVLDLLKAIETGATDPVSVIHPDSYIQHNLGAADGLAGFSALLQAIPEGTARVDTVRVFQDGDKVFTHTDYDFFGPKIGFDIFRFDNGFIVEHWDNLQETPPGLNPSGHSMIDGPTEATDLDATEENKALVTSFVSEILVNGELDKLAGYFNGEDYVQHNPNIADTLTGLGAGLAALAAEGIVMRYETIHQVLGEGNFVLVVSEGSFADAPTAFYDLFRVANGKIAEHWDVLETIPPEEERRNGNGKF